MDKKEFGKKIKLARVECDLTQEQLAEKINTKQKNISRYETGSSMPSIETLIKIAGILKKRVSYFFNE
jgi:transcriptional regulator with XRE-family HTH domain